MVEKKEKTREEVIADYVSEKHAAAKSSRKARRVDDGDATVTINSLMDAMTIILVFLLMNYSIDPLKVDGGDDLSDAAARVHECDQAHPYTSGYSECELNYRW